MIAHFARSSRTWTAVGACLVLALALVALTDAVKAEDPAAAAPAPSAMPAPAGRSAATKPSAQPLPASATYDELAKSDAAIAQYLNQLRTLEFRRAQRSQALNEKHPEVAALDAEINQTKRFMDAMAAAHRDRVNQPTKLKNGDLVTVSVMDLVGQGVETVKTARIDGDGTISLPYTGAVKAAGLSPLELEKAVAKGYLDKGVIQNAVVAVSLPERGESHQIARVRGAMPEIAAAAGPITAGGFQNPVMMEDPEAMRGIPAPAPGAPASGMTEAAMMMEDPAAMGMAPPAAPMDEATRALLARKIPEMKIDSVPFADVVDALRDLTSSNIFVNWRALEAAGIDRNVPVSLRLRDVAFKDVLSLVLRNVGGGTTYKVENGVVVIDAPKQPAKAPKLSTKTYEVRNLLSGEITEQTTKAQMSELQRVVITTVQPATWQRGGSGIAAFDSRLIVTAPDDVHKEVAQLLKMLQRDAAKPTTNPTKGNGAELGF